MRVFTIVFAAALFAASSIPVAADTAVTTLSGGAERWAPLPGPVRGLMQAVLLGDPSKSGFFVVRIKAPSNYRFMPHQHPNRHNITVLSGTYYLGIGTHFNSSAMTAYRAGSFISVAAGVPHYAMVGSGGAMVQEDGMGPNVIEPLKQ